MSESTVYKNPEKSIDERVTDLISRMNSREMLAQLCSIIVPFGQPPVTSQGDQLSDSFCKSVADGLGGVAYLHMGLKTAQSVQYSQLMQSYMLKNTRLGIPLFLFEEALTGFVSYESTQFPSAQNLAATFDPELVERCFAAISKEARARGANMVLAPVADLGRDPRWGRVVETFGEDALLVSRMVAAAVSGFQGGRDGVKPGHVAATLKHFAGFGQSDGGRQMAPVNAGQNMMNNEILPSFRYSVQHANVAAVMPAYHDIDGIPCHANKWLLDTVLRKRWGFDRLVVCDFGGIGHLVGMHNYAQNELAAAKMALNCGIDMDLPEGTGYWQLLDEMETDRTIRERVVQSCKRVLTLKFQLGLFENPWPDQNAIHIVSCDKHQDLTVKAGVQSVVLLKNENQLLPLDIKKYKKIACIGPHSNLLHMGEDRRGRITIFEGIKKLVPESVEVVWSLGCTLTSKDAKPPVYLEETAHTKLTDLQKIDTNEKLASLYKSETPQLIPPGYEQDSIQEAVETAKRSDVVVLCLGESSWCIGENYSATRRTDRDTIDLIGNQIQLLRELKKTDTPIVVMLVHGRTLAIDEIIEHADAILDLWDPGEQRGTVAAKVLLGMEEPGGRLPVTIPSGSGQLPCYYSQKPSGYTRAYAFRDKRIAYPFGYGLTYTDFEIVKSKLSSDAIKCGDTVCVNCEIKNVGDRRGTAVVQVYVSYKQGDATVCRPLRELKEFRRIQIEPLQTERIEIPLSPDVFSYVNAEKQDAFIKGKFSIDIGFDSESVIEHPVSVL